MFLNQSFSSETGISVLFRATGAPCGFASGREIHQEPLPVAGDGEAGLLFERRIFRYCSPVFARVRSAEVDAGADAFERLSAAHAT